MSAHAEDLKAEFGLGVLRRVIVGVAVIAVVVGVVLWLRPWESGGTVRFDYRAMFTYLGSEDNEPLENLLLKWSAPQIDNTLIEETYSTWELYYIEEDNTLILQATPTGVINLRGFRASQLGIYSFGHECEQYGPALNFQIDKLYPREVFLNIGHVIVEKEKAEELTLCVYGQTAPVGAWQAFGQEDKKIDFSLVAGLYQENTLIEQYEWTQENGLYGSYWLWSV